MKYSLSIAMILSVLFINTLISKQTHDELVHLNKSLDELISITIENNKPKPILLEWYGKSQLDHDDILNTIEHVLSQFPKELDDVRGFKTLLLETIATESMFGYYTKQINGTAIGVFQIEPRTYKDIQDHYLRYHKDLRDFILKFKNRKVSNTHNLQYNIQYQIAYAIVIYYRNWKNEVLDTHTNRYSVYKRIWNTHLGAGNYPKYIRDKQLYITL